MDQALFALRWYLIVQLFGLSALPICFRLFRFLPDRGYGVSKPFGLLLSGWLFWMLTTLGWTRNTAGGILIAVGIVAISGVLLSRLQIANCKLQIPNPQSPIPNHKSPITNHQSPIAEIVVVEILFLVAFVAWAIVRVHMPRIETAGGEKWMEIAFLRAILRSETFPPHDPWLSGFAISYYYFGYVIVAMLTRLSAVPPSIAFNLGIATWFALVCAASFSLVYNLIAAERKGGGLWALLGGFLGPLLVVLMGNLEGFLEWLHARGIGPATFWAWLDIRNIDGPPPALVDGSWAPTRFFWWWQASRVVQDYTPWGTFQEVIDEFPVFSFILGDMHPHLLALPFVLLALALALNLYLRILNSPSPLSTSYSLLPILWWEFALYALSLGGLGFLNTWDFPIYLFIVVAAYALALTHHASRITYYVLRAIAFFFPLFIIGVLLYLPFWVGFQSQAGGILINLFNPTRLPHFLAMFGPLLFIVIVYVVEQAARARVRFGEVTVWTLLAVFVITTALAAGIGLLVALVQAEVVEPSGVIAYVSAWLRGEPLPGLEGVENIHALVSQRIWARVFNQWTSLTLFALLVAISLSLLRALRPLPPSPTPPLSLSPSHFALLLLAVGALLALSVEYVYLRDHFGTRMNTVFKFYFQTWVMWGIAGAYALASWLGRLPHRLRVIFLLTPAILLIAAGLFYPALAIPARAHESGDAPTLDGAVYLAKMYPDDYAAIAWLNEHVSGAPVILEAPGDHFRAYIYEGRVSAHTGLPTLLGWGDHQNQWRGNYDEPARREPDIEALYSSTDPVVVRALLDKYNVEYVYVGPLEQTRYPPAGLAKFAGMLETVYHQGKVTIYRVPRERWK